MAIDKRIVDLLSQVLNPEDLGYAASPALRDIIRFALGRPPVESDLVAYFLAGRSKARSDVLAERARQQYEENYSTRHDDKYFPGVLARAAACYADGRLTWCTVGGQRLWPFDREFYKPRSERENWVRAAALLIAEIERSDRADVGVAQIKAHVMRIAGELRDKYGEIGDASSLVIEREPSSNREPVSADAWNEALQISELPDVDECLRSFSADSTEDNAVCLVRAIIAAAKKGGA